MSTSIIILVAGFNPSEKYEFVNWGYYSQLNGKVKAMFQSPPTSILIIDYH